MARLYGSFRRVYLLLANAGKFEGKTRPPGRGERQAPEAGYTLRDFKLNQAR